MRHEDCCISSIYQVLRTETIPVEIKKDSIWGVFKESPRCSQVEGTKSVMASPGWGHTAALQSLHNAYLELPLISSQKQTFILPMPLGPPLPSPCSQKIMLTPNSYKSYKSPNEYVLNFPSPRLTMKLMPRPLSPPFLLAPIQTFLHYSPPVFLDLLSIPHSCNLAKDVTLSYMSSLHPPITPSLMTPSHWHLNKNMLEPFLLTTHPSVHTHMIFLFSISPCSCSPSPSSPHSL